MKPNSQIANFIGNTPLIKIAQTNVYVKLEEFNAGGSVKARPALAMILDAETKGILTPFSGQTILEPTGGNLGIGLAQVAINRGYNLKLVIPDNFSKEKQKTLQIYGAAIILSDSTTGNDSHFQMAKKILAKHPEYVFLNQFGNPANPAAHYHTTGKELVTALNHIDYFVASIGSGGTITGVSKRILECFPQAKIFAAQPEGCDILNGKVVPHKIQGTAIGILAPFIPLGLITGCISVSYEQTVTTIKEVAKENGILVGLSSGTNISAALSLASEVGPEKVIVTIAPDSGKSYLEHF